MMSVFQKQEIENKVFSLRDEYLQCLEDIKIAENHLNYVEGEFLDTAIYQYNALLAKQKSLFEMARREKLV